MEVTPLLGPENEWAEGGRSPVLPRSSGLVEQGCIRTKQVAFFSQCRQFVWVGMAFINGLKRADL